MVRVLKASVRMLSAKKQVGQQALELSETPCQRLGDLKWGPDMPLLQPTFICCCERLHA